MRIDLKSWWKLKNAEKYYTILSVETNGSQSESLLTLSNGKSYYVSIFLDLFELPLHDEHNQPIVPIKQLTKKD